MLVSSQAMIFNDIADREEDSINAPHRPLPSKKISVKTAVIYGLIVAIFFPLDEGGELTTIRGKLHLILIVISGIFVVVSLVFFWLRMRTLEGWIGFAWFSIASLPIIFILMILSGVFGGGPYMGLVERFMVSYFQIYYFVISLMIFIRN